MSNSRFGGASPGSNTPLPGPEIFGFPTETALELSRALENVRPISHRISVDGQVLQGLIGIFPLLERTHAGEKIPLGEVRAHEDSIKQIVHPFVDKHIPDNPIARSLGRFGKFAIDHLVELGFDQATAFAMSVAREYVPRAEPYVKLISGFDNPRQQFLEEIEAANLAILSAVESEGEQPGARTVARAIRKTLFEGILSGSDETRESFPIFSGSLAIRNTRARQMRFSERRIAALAPGILMMLDAPLPPDERRNRFIQSAKDNPIDSSSSPVSQQEIEAFSRSAPVILLAARDLIPQTGDEVIARFEEIKEFLKA